MSVCIYDISHCSEQEYIRIMHAMNVHQDGITIMTPRTRNTVLRIKSVDTRAALILKQEALSSGAEAAVSAQVMNLHSGTTDVLLMGRHDTLMEVTEKCRRQPFGLPRISDAVACCLKRRISAPIPYNGGVLDYSEHPLIMGILNCTPDSFYDGGKYPDTESLVAHGMNLVAAGADIIDIGGASSRPGADDISAEEEIRRVVPVIENITKNCTVPISIDTMKAKVARAAVAAGASIINDISALYHDPAMARVAAETHSPVILMHMKGTPQTMQKSPNYTDVVDEIALFLSNAASHALQAGIARDRIILDPGIGFGKTVQQNYTLLRNTPVFKSLGFPLLIGVSNKSLIGAVLNTPVHKRTAGTMVLNALSLCGGADIIRTHDVQAAQDTIALVDAYTTVDISHKYE